MQEAAQRMKVHQRLGAVVLAVVVTLAIALFRDELARFERYGYPGVFLVSLLGNATVIFPAPSLAVVFGMGGVLNPLLVGLVAGVGEALGELTGYLAGYGGATPLENTRLYQRFDRWMDRFGPLVVFVLAVIPNPLFDMAGLLAGASHMPWWQFLAAAWTGKTIQAVFLAYAGALSLEWVTQFFA